jgi:hypothetical protein
VARELWLNLTALIDEPYFGARRTRETRERWLSDEGRRKLNDELKAALAGPKRAELYERLELMAGRSGPVLARWAPLATAPGAEIALVAKFAELHRQMVLALRSKQFIDAGLDNPGSAPPAEAFTAITLTALKLDEDLMRSGGELAAIGRPSG